MAFITDITTTPVTGSYGADGLPLGVDNRHGNIRDGGNIAATGDWSSSSLGEGNPVTTIVDSATAGTVQANSGATFNDGDNQVIMRDTTTIAGLSNTVLEGGSSDSANMAYTPLQLAVMRNYYYKTAVRQGNWNIFSGAFSSAVSSATSGAWNISSSVDNSSTLRSSGTDIAANPTQDIPGRITYRDGSPNPIQSGYGPRYNW